MAVAFIHIIRLVTMGVVLLFSVIILGLSAHLTSTTEKFLFYYKFAAMAIAISVLTMLTLPVLIIVDFLRKGAFTSLVAVELGWLGLLWVLWLATAALATDAGLYVNGCSPFGVVDNLFTTACHEYQAIEAFSYLNWLIIKGYWVLLLVASIIAATRGHNIWTSTVKDNLFFAPRVGDIKQETSYPQQQYPQTTGQQYPGQYPPQQNMQGYPNPTHTPPIQSNYGQV